MDHFSNLNRQKSWKNNKNRQSFLLDFHLLGYLIFFLLERTNLGCFMKFKIALDYLHHFANYPNNLVFKTLLALIHTDHLIHNKVNQNCQIQPNSFRYIHQICTQDIIANINS